MTDCVGRRNEGECAGDASLVSVAQGPGRVKEEVVVFV
jgi:hypothetical protein